MIGKGFGGKRSWPNLRCYGHVRPEGLKNTTKNSISIAGRRRRDWNPVPLEYEAGMLGSRPRRWVNVHLSGCETWSLTSKEEYGFSVFNPLKPKLL
jgi:hypothetical protein